MTCFMTKMSAFFVPIGLGPFSLGLIMNSCTYCAGILAIVFISFLEDMGQLLMRLAGTGSANGGDCVGDGQQVARTKLHSESVVGSHLQDYGGSLLGAVKQIGSSYYFLTAVRLVRARRIVCESGEGVTEKMLLFQNQNRNFGSVVSGHLAQPRGFTRKSEDLSVRPGNWA